MSIEGDASSTRAFVELLREEPHGLESVIRAEADLEAARALRVDERAGEPALGLEAEDAGEAEALLERTLLETDRVSIIIQADASAALDGIDVRVHLGNVPIAGTRPEEPGESELRRVSPERLEMPVGQPFLDCAGTAVLSVLVSRGDDGVFVPAARVLLRVLPAKITPEELDRLVAELEEAANEVLFDAYAKTMTGLRRGSKVRRLPPAVQLERIRGILDLFGAELSRISNRPAQRLTLSPRRVGIYPGEAITPETLAGIIEDTTFLTRTRAGVELRERVEMAAERDVKLPEHAALSGFLASLAIETRGVLLRLKRAIESRLAERHSFAAGETGIWAEREAPRIRALQGLLARAQSLISACRELRRRYELLPPDAPPLERPPDLTKRFAHVGAYSVLYRAMREHFQSHELDFADSSVLVTMKSLPLLWEYWVVLKVIQVLQRKLRYSISPWESSGSLFRRLGGFRSHCVFELSSDRRLELVDASGRRVLFRYQPRYATMWNARKGRGASFGRLRRHGAPFEPDIAIEVYPPGSAESAQPDHIVILDAKYSSRSHEDILQSVLRYRNIGELKSGRRLVRQIWALTNAPPEQRPSAGRGGLETHVTLDNEAFLEDGFSPLGEVCGVVSVRPREESAQAPLELLLARVFTVLGVV